MLVLGVLLLTVVSLFSVFLEELLPIEVDTVVGFMLLTGFIAKFAFGKPAWKRSVLDIPVLILIAAGLITLTAMTFRGSDYLRETAAQLISLIMVMGMSLVIVQILRDFRSIGLTLLVFTLITAAIALLGILALLLNIQTIYIGGAEITVARRWGGVGVRIGGAYEQPNIFATPLVLALPLSVAFALTGASRVRQLFWVGAAGICAVALLLSQSRSGTLGAFLGILMMSVILARGIKPSKLICYVIVIGLFAYGALTMTGMLNPALERLSPSYQAYQLETGRPEQNRLLIWQRALPLAFQNPFGYGAETAYLIGASFGIERKGVHNVFLSSLTGLGWLGFVGILLLVIKPIRRLWRFVYRVSNTEWKVIGAGLLGGLVGFWIHNLFHSMIHWMAVWIYFACVAATIQLTYIGEGGTS